MVVEFYDQDGESIWITDGSLHAHIGEQVRLPYMARKKIGDDGVYIVEGTIISIVHDMARNATVFVVSIGEAD